MRLVELGKSLIAGGEFDRAAAMLRDAINVDPGNGVAYFHLAEADVKLGQGDAAAGLLDKAEALLGADGDWMERIEALRGELGIRELKPRVPIEDEEF